MWSRLSIILIFLCGFVFAFFVTTIPGPHFLWLTFRRIPLAGSLNFGEEEGSSQPVMMPTGLDLPTEHGKARADYPLTLPAQLQSKSTQKTEIKPGNVISPSPASKSQNASDAADLPPQRRGEVGRGERGGGPGAAAPEDREVPSARRTKSRADGLCDKCDRVRPLWMDQR
uniref:Uncharacterized protein n=1 Tax=Branchiostoma floridae TaxID=7739 RepID=C3Z6E0_BRAFL|eukprot:XP_002595872.1 hypothetical protein BRAFLDRAFT_123776 [Branchiostoma floridae]